MQVSTNVSKRATVNVPDNVAYVEGQVCGNLRTGAILAVSGQTTALGFQVAGVAMVDVPVKQAYNPATSLAIPNNSPRATPFATEGLVAIRVLDAANYAALALDGNFGIVNGFAVTVGLAGSSIAGGSASASTLWVKEKVVAASGAFFIIVEIN
jgi:hypothetical protein